MLWKDVRVVECVGLENRYAQAGIGGSNPPLSAKQLSFELKRQFFIFIV